MATRYRLCFEGYVRSVADGQPISGASVGWLSGGGDAVVAVTRTDLSGFYSLSCPPHGQGRLLRARKNGWSVQEIWGVTYSTEAQRYDFSLEPTDL